MIGIAYGVTLLIALMRMATRAAGRYPQYPSKLWEWEKENLSPMKSPSPLAQPFAQNANVSILPDSDIAISDYVGHRLLKHPLLTFFKISLPYRA